MSGKAQKIQAYQTGLWAENLAALLLMSKGFHILHRRYKTRFGEIDLIAQRAHSKLLVFAEVKARTDKEQALYAITPKTRRRIEQAAMHFLAENPGLNDCDMRFDVIAVSGILSIHHLDNAWMEGQ